MPTLNVRIDDRTKNELDAIARARGVTVSDVVREYIDERHGSASESFEDAATPRTLSLEERHRLVLMHQILGQTDPDGDAEGYHSRAIEALQMGYSAEYSDEFAGYSREMPLRDCRLVWDILDLFRVVAASIDVLSPADRDSLTTRERDLLAFGGFDMNDRVEGALLLYARYLIEGDKWAELAPAFGPGRDRGNSHAPRLGRYRRMLDVYTPMWEALARDHRRYTLNLRELRAIAAAA